MSRALVTGASWVSAHPEYIESEIVPAGKDIRTQDVHLGGEECPGDAFEQPRTVPPANPHFAVSLLRPRDPFENGCVGGRVFPRKMSLQKCPEETNMACDLFRIEHLKVALGHVFKMGLDFLSEILWQSPHDRLPHVLEVLPELRYTDFSALEIVGHPSVENPDKPLFPVGPILIAGALAVGQSKKHQGVEVGAVTNDAGELGDGGGVIEIPLLRRERELVVGVDQRNEHAAALWRELQASRHFLRQNGTRILVITFVAGLAGIVKEKRQIEDGGIFQLLKQGAVTTELLGLGKKDAVEFLDADKSMLVGRVAMIKFVLDQASECAELRNIASEKAEVVHFAQDAADLALP